MAEDKPKKPPDAKPEHGADSQLRCYNAASWRLDRLFETEEEPEDDAAKPSGDATAEKQTGVRRP